MADKYTVNTKLSNRHIEGIGTYIAIVVVSVLLFSLGAFFGSRYQEKVTADNGPKPVPLPAYAANNTDDTLAKASKLATSGQMPQAIALLTPYVNDSSKPQPIRALGATALGQYELTVKDPTAAITWFQLSDKLSTTPQLVNVLGVANASMQLYSSKLTGSATPTDSATSNLKQDAITGYQKALTMTQDAGLKAQINQQLTAATKLP